MNKIFQILSDSMATESKFVVLLLVKKGKNLKTDFRASYENKRTDSNKSK